MVATVHIGHGGNNGEPVRACVKRNHPGEHNGETNDVNYATVQSGS